jgi:hypothetical protein
MFCHGHWLASGHSCTGCVALKIIWVRFGLTKGLNYSSEYLIIHFVFCHSFEICYLFF